MCRSTHEVRGQLCGVRSAFPPLCEFWGPSSGCYACAASTFTRRVFPLSSFWTMEWCWILSNAPPPHPSPAMCIRDTIMLLLSIRYTVVIFKNVEPSKICLENWRETSVRARECVPQVTQDRKAGRVAGVLASKKLACKEKWMVPVWGVLRGRTATKQVTEIEMSLMWEKVGFSKQEVEVEGSIITLEGFTVRGRQKWGNHKAPATKTTHSEPGYLEEGNWLSVGACSKRGFY